MENALHELPFFGRREAFLYKLEFRHIVFPLCLAGQGGEARHGAVPLKVEGRFNNHKEARAEDVDFHFKDANFADSGNDFLPSVFLAVALAVFCNKFGIVAQVQGLAVTLYGTMILLYGITVLGSVHRNG